MLVQRGDVVLIDFPFSRGGKSKVRPALIVQNDLDNRRLANTIIAQITSRIDRTGQPTQYLIDLSTADGKLSGLMTNSSVNCVNLFTIHQEEVLRILGTLSTSAMSDIDKCLGAALDLE